MRAIVTGGAGFIGSHLIEALLARNDHVLCIERPGACQRWIAGLDVTCLHCGIHDVTALAEVFEEADVVFHLAGLTEARSAAEFYEVNTEGTACVLQAAAVHDGLAPRVILLSSLAAVGPCRNGDLLTPDSVPYPLSHYGRSKLLAEAVTHAYADRVPTTIVRLPSVYGPRERAVLTLFKLVKRGLALTIGGWEREVSMIYVKDAVQGLIAAATHQTASGRTYYLAYPEPTSWSGFARTVAAAMGREPFLLSVPRPIARLVALGAELCAALRRHTATLNRERVREMSQERWVCDPSRAIHEIGFRPAFSFARGLAETVAWYREAQWI